MLPSDAAEAAQAARDAERAAARAAEHKMNRDLRKMDRDVRRFAQSGRITDFLRENKDLATSTAEKYLPKGALDVVFAQTGGEASVGLGDPGKGNGDVKVGVGDGFLPIETYICVDGVPRKVRIAIQKIGWD